MDTQQECHEHVMILDCLAEVTLRAQDDGIVSGRKCRVAVATER